MSGVILYGPPASGKDTVTAELAKVDDRFVLLPRLKSGSGRTAGYRIVSEAEIDELRTRGKILYENRRYGATYALDRDSLIRALTTSIPVLHLGQLAGIEAVRQGFPDECWLTVSLWCPRNIAAERIASRDTNDDEARLRAWDATERITSDLTINTANVSARDAALQIESALDHLCTATA
ncbi:MAG: kinase [Acidobacteriales bacterium]|nr:kinase [Terriglobales bacterium]